MVHNLFFSFTKMGRLFLGHVDRHRSPHKAYTSRCFRWDNLMGDSLALASEPGYE